MKTKNVLMIIILVVAVVVFVDFLADLPEGTSPLSKIHPLYITP